MLHLVCSGRRDHKRLTAHVGPVLPADACMPFPSTLACMNLPWSADPSRPSRHGELAHLACPGTGAAPQRAAAGYPTVAATQS